MPDIHISVRNKIAAQTDRIQYVCGNSDYRLVFDFDDEWEGYDVKTACFVVNGKPIHYPFEGNICPVPVLMDAFCFFVGVFSGNLRTTTSARITARKSCLGNDGWPTPPPPDTYNQLIELINNMEGGGMPDVTEDDALAVLMQTDTVQPITDGTGTIFTDADGSIYSL